MSTPGITNVELLLQMIENISAHLDDMNRELSNADPQYKVPDVSVQ